MGNRGGGMGLALYWARNWVQVVLSLKLLKMDDAAHDAPIR